MRERIANQILRSLRLPQDDANDDCASNEPLGAMVTALSGHVSRECQHAHAEPWAWHPSMRLIGRPVLSDLRKILLQLVERSGPALRHTSSCVDEGFQLFARRGSISFPGDGHASAIGRLLR